MGLRSVVMARSTVTKDDGVVTVQGRCFISSLALGVVGVARVIWGHWLVESMYWHFDVTFREDKDHTLDKHVAYNLHYA